MGALRTYKSGVWKHFARVEDGNDVRAECHYCDATFSMKGGSTGNLKRHIAAKHPTVLQPIETFSTDLSSLRSRSPISNDSDIIITVIEDEGVDSFLSEVDSGRSPWKKTATLNLTKVQKPDHSSVSSTCDASIVSSKKDLNSSASSAIICGHPSQSQATTKVNDVHPVTNRDIDMQLLKMVCSNYLNFSIVEDKNFIKTIKLLNPNYCIPSRNTLSNTLLEGSYQQCLKDVMNQLEEAHAVVITCESWTTLNNNSCFALTAHFINSRTELCSKFLDYFEIEKSDNANSGITTWLGNVVKEFKINEKISAVVTDDDKIMEAVNNLKFVHLPCFGHSLNSVIQNAVSSSLKEMLEKIKLIVKFFKNNSTALSKLLELQKKLNIEPVKLKLDLPTHWNSTYDMLRRVRINKNAIMSALFVLQSEYCLSPAEWELIDSAVNILKTFHEVTEEMTSEQVLFLSKIPILAQIMEKRVKTYQIKTSSPIIKKFLNELLDGLNKYFGDVEGVDLVSQAVFLDPRFKKQGFKNDSKFSSAYQSIVGKLKAIGIKTLEPEIEVTEKPRLSLWEEFDNNVVKLKAVSDPSAVSIAEVDMYLGEPLLNRIYNPLEWWETRKTAYPNLYNLMLKSLSVPATSVTCERFFCKEGQPCSEKRSCPSSKNLGKILFINSNLN